MAIPKVGDWIREDTMASLMEMEEDYIAKATAHALKKITLSGVNVSTESRKILEEHLAMSLTIVTYSEKDKHPAHMTEKVDMASGGVHAVKKINAITVEKNGEHVVTKEGDSLLEDVATADLDVASLVGENACS